MAVKLPGFNRFDVWAPMRVIKDEAWTFFVRVQTRVYGETFPFVESLSDRGKNTPCRAARFQLISLFSPARSLHAMIVF